MFYKFSCSSSHLISFSSSREETVPKRCDASWTFSYSSVPDESACSSSAFSFPSESMSFSSCSSSFCSFQLSFFLVARLVSGVAVAAFSSFSLALASAFC